MKKVAEIMGVKVLGYSNADADADLILDDCVLEIFNRPDAIEFIFSELGSNNKLHKLIHLKDGIGYSHTNTLFIGQQSIHFTLSTYGNVSNGILYAEKSKSLEFYCDFHHKIFRYRSMSEGNTWKTKHFS